MRSRTIDIRIFLLKLLKKLELILVQVLVVECEDALEGWLLEKLSLSEKVLIPPKKVTSVSLSNANSRQF